MRRLTRGIGLFGGTAAVMTAKRIKAPPRKTEERQPDAGPVAPPEPKEPAPPERKGWLQRLFGSDDDSGK
jgi:hypothetical protein